MANKELKTLQKEKKKLVDYKWIIIVFTLAFTISFGFSSASQAILKNANTIVGVILIIVFILIGILFDMIGVAVTSSDVAPFHSMNSRKVKGANIAVKFIKNADKVSSFCNDVIGDICGIVSGAAGSLVSVNVATYLKTDIFVTTLVVTSIIAALTIGGKAIGKSFAINKSNFILYHFSKIIAIFYKPKK